MHCVDALMHCVNALCECTCCASLVRVVILGLLKVMPIGLGLDWIWIGLARASK
jgi:hypothetical protein